MSGFLLCAAISANRLDVRKSTWIPPSAMTRRIQFARSRSLHVIDYTPSNNLLHPHRYRPVFQNYHRCGLVAIGEVSQRYVVVLHNTYASVVVTNGCEISFGHETPQQTWKSASGAVGRHCVQECPIAVEQHVKSNGNNTAGRSQCIRSQATCHNTRGVTTETTRESPVAVRCSGANRWRW